MKLINVFCLHCFCLKLPGKPGQKNLKGIKIILLNKSGNPKSFKKMVPVQKFTNQSACKQQRFAQGGLRCNYVSYKFAFTDQLQNCFYIFFLLFSCRSKSKNQIARELVVISQQEIFLYFIYRQLKSISEPCQIQQTQFS